MKKMIYLLLLVFLPSSLIFADHGHKNLEGNWFERNAGHGLKIKSKSYGIKIKGLNGIWGWRKMRHTDVHNVFADRNGNSIEVLNRNQIVYISRKGRGYKVTHYVRGKERHRVGGRSDDYYRRYNSREYNSGYGEYRYRGEGYGSENPQNNSRDIRVNRSAEKDIIGKWISPNTDKTVYIKKDGDGIKARFGGSSKWTFYYNDFDEPGVFVDRKGNRYRLKSKERLEWISFDGKEIKLKRD